MALANLSADERALNDEPTLLIQSKSIHLLITVRCIVAAKT